MIFVVVGLAFVMSVTPKPFIEGQGASMEKDPAQTNMKRLSQRMLCGSFALPGFRGMEGGYCQLNSVSDKSNTDQLEGTTKRSDNTDILHSDISSLASNRAVAARETVVRQGLEGEAITAPSEDANCELVTTRVAPASGQPQVDFPSDELVDFALPSPPSDFPEVQDRKDSVPISNDNVDSIPSSRSERDSYTWNSAMCDLPNPLFLNDNEERIISSHEDELAVKKGFEENINYKLSTCIGGGAFGTCHLAVTPVPDPAGDTNEGTVFCVKKCEYRHDELLALKLASVDHIAEIVQFFGAKLKGKNARIFMEFVAGGTIKDLIEETKSSEMNREAPWPVISEIDSLWYLEDVLKALKFLHAKGIVHRDVKGANVLLTEGFRNAKLADFGSAKSINKESPSVDIWSTGCLTLEMLEGERSPLFARGYQRQISLNPEDHIPAEAIPDIKDLLRLLFGANITDQDYALPTAEEILRESKAFPVKEFLKRHR